MHLTVHDYRVDHRAHVIDDPITNDVDRPGPRIDLDLASVAAV